MEGWGEVRGEELFPQAEHDFSKDGGSFFFSFYDDGYHYT